ncbi:hypothetical protein EDB84DRAFT_1620893 [Lactarius hengduanensis]|nr:hypothetical protein EDB84DRAFT_1620893 [Lactarius hengduanensis]
MSRQVRKTQTTWEHTGHPAAAGWTVAAAVIRLKGYPTTVPLGPLISHFELSTDPSLSRHTQATHSPAPVSGHASHVTYVTASIVPTCRRPVDLALTTSPAQHALTRTPPPRYRHPPSRRHLTPSPNCPNSTCLSLPQPPPPPLPTTTHTSNITTSTTRKYRNPPLPPQLPPSPPLLPTTHASNASAASTRPPSAIYRPRPPTLSSTLPPPDSMHRATAATPPPLSSHPTNPIPPNRPGPTPPPQPRLHAPRHCHNTTTLALTSHQPRPAQPPWPNLILGDTVDDWVLITLDGMEAIKQLAVLCMQRAKVVINVLNEGRQPVARDDEWFPVHSGCTYICGATLG